MRFLRDTSILTATMAAAFFLLDFERAAIVIGAVLAGYFIWDLVLLHRAKLGPSLPVTLLMVGFQVTVPIMVLGASIAIVFAWAGSAYRVDMFPMFGPSIWLVPAFLVVAPALYLGVAPPLFLALARIGGKGGAAADFLVAVREKGFAPFRASWLGTSALYMAYACLAVLYFHLPGLAEISANWNIAEEPTPWQLAATFPFVPLGLAASAVLLSIFRTVILGAGLASQIVEVYEQRAEDTRTPAARMGVLASAAVLCGWCVTLYVVLYPLHVGVVAASSSVAGILPATRTAEAVEHWADGRRADGGTGAEMARVLNARGRWNADSPETGLPVLFPDLKAALPAGDSAGIGKCAITVVAGAVDPADVRGAGWLEAEQARSDLRYCVRVSCPSPVIWDPPQAVVLYSSHPSRNKRWTGNYFIDLFADGRALVPGGYCTAEGGLTDRFEG